MSPSTVLSRKILNSSSSSCFFTVICMIRYNPLCGSVCIPCAKKQTWYIKKKKKKQPCLAGYGNSSNGWNPVVDLEIACQAKTPSSFIITTDASVSLFSTSYPRAVSRGDCGQETLGMDGSSSKLSFLPHWGWVEAASRALSAEPALGWKPQAEPSSDSCHGVPELELIEEVLLWSQWTELHVTVMG